MTLVPNIIWLMALGTVALDIALVVKIVALLHHPSRVRIQKGGDKYGLLVIFMLSTLALVGTLWLQYGAGLAPCVFCWYQRIFMYPIPLLSLVAMMKGKTLSDVSDYILALSFFGFAFALYQHLLQVLPSGALIPCDAANDCAVRSVFEFGFVTLPWMAVTMFTAIFIIALVARKKFS